MKLAYSILLITVLITATISALYVAFVSPMIQSREPIRDNDGNIIMDFTPINAFLEVFITSLGAAIATSVVVAVVMGKQNRRRAG